MFAFSVPVLAFVVLVPLALVFAFAVGSGCYAVVEGERFQLRVGHGGSNGSFHLVNQGPNVNANHWQNHRAV